MTTIKTAIIAEKKEAETISATAEKKEVYFSDEYFENRKKEKKESKRIKACFSNVRLLKQISPNEFGFNALRKSLIHKSFEYFIMLGNRAKPFSSIHDSTKSFDITFSHGIKLIKKWEKIGLLERIKPKGSRSVKIILTKKGQRIREHLIKIQEVLNDTKKNFAKIVKKIRVERGMEK
jgi:hypothetical protein